MAKNLKTLINLAPSKAEPITGSVQWFHQQMTNNGCAWMCGQHGNADNGGGGRADWVVPAGVTTATFHLWGAGGSGAAGYCCTQGINGASGAYAKKKISVSAGQRFVLCTGSVGERNCINSGVNRCWDACAQATPAPITPADDTGGWDPSGAACSVIGGCRGSKVYVLGPNLTNLCAEGGAGGIGAWRGLMDEFPREQRPGPSGQNGGKGQCHCCNSYVCACDYLGRDPDDSDGSRFRAACYYGADYGARGLFAKGKHSCCGRFNQSNCYHAGYINYLSFPAGKWWMGNTISTGWGFWAGSHAQNCTDNDWGSFGPHGTARRQHTAGNVIANNNFDNGHMMMGVGGLTAWTCGGTCCCGGSGGGGAIVVNYEQDKKIWLRI